MKRFFKIVYVTDLSDFLLVRVMKYQKRTVFLNSKRLLNTMQQYVKTKDFKSLCPKEWNMYSAVCKMQPIDLDVRFDKLL